MKVLNYFLSFLFFIVILVFSVIGLRFSNGKYLEMENRNKSEKPKLTLETISRGNYFKDLDKYLQDNFPLREDILISKVYINGKILKRPFVNNIYYKNKKLLPKIEVKEQNEKNNIENLNDIVDYYKNLDNLCKKNNVKFLYVGLPSDWSMFSDIYPNYAQNLLFNEEIEEQFKKALEKNNINSIFLRRELEKNRYENYYMLDHHISAKGQLIVLREILKNFGIKEKEYIYKTIDKDFIGSRGRLVPNLHGKEKIGYYIPKEEVPYVYIANGNKEDIIKIDNSKETVDYSIFMSGDMAEAVVDTNREYLPNMVIYGDSYTNTIESLIYIYFNKMYSFDFRYKDNNESMEEIIKKTKPKYMVIIRDSGNYLNYLGNGKIKLYN